MQFRFLRPQAVLPPRPFASHRKDSELHYRALFDNKTAAIAHCRVITNAEGRPVDYVIEEVNKVFEHVRGVRRAAIEGRLLTEFYPAVRNFDFDVIGTYGRIGLEGGEGNFEVYHPHEDKWFNVFCYSHRRGWFTLVFLDITEKKRGQLALEQSERRFSALFNNVTQGVAQCRLVCDADGRPVDYLHLAVNDAACRIMNLPREAFEGRRYSELFPQEQDLEPDLVAIFGGVVQQGTEVDMRFPFPASKQWFAVRAIAAGGDEFTVMFTDITAQKQSQAMLESMFRQAAVGMAIVDMDGRVIRANQRLADLLGYRLADLPGQAFREVTHTDDLPANLDKFRQLLRGEISEYTIEKRYRCADGSYKWCLASVALARDEASFAPYLVAVIKDISERKQLEAELEQARQELELRVQERTRELQLAKQQAEEALRTAEAASQARMEFLAIMSHEIRTPLNGVIGFNGLLLDGELNEEKRPYAELARQSGESLLHLLNDFLDFSKIEAGHLELELTDFDLDEEISLVLSLVREAAHQKQLTLTRRFQAPRRLRGDAARLRQILLNLVSNAVKFTEAGEITLSCEELRRHNHVTWLRIEVRDTGIGIDPALRDKLFQPFVQADASTTRRFGGTGLGLAICKRLAEAMGGSIGMSSTPGEGSIFRIELPFERRESPEQLALPVAARTAEIGSRRRVLVVEDNPVSQQLASAMLKRMGCRADVVGNGKEAIDAWRRLPYDLILMDCDMPVMDGLEATRQIRAAEAPGQRIPIIAITASVLAGDAERCREAGMDDFIAKPVRHQELSQKVLACLRPLQEQVT
ncbi:MAG: domain S-box protein [Moraxellaceae bacterium]|jgi:PAS domain S-box-containing protein|nr:domain S-box protein [Moraxellaceae bacterium]